MHLLPDPGSDNPCYVAVSRSSSLLYADRNITPDYRYPALYWRWEERSDGVIITTRSGSRWAGWSGPEGGRIDRPMCSTGPDADKSLPQRLGGPTPPPGNGKQRPTGRPYEERRRLPCASRRGTGRDTKTKRSHAPKMDVTREHSPYFLVHSEGVRPSGGMAEWSIADGGWFFSEPPVAPCPIHDR